MKRILEIEQPESGDVIWIVPSREEAVRAVHGDKLVPGFRPGRKDRTMSKNMPITMLYWLVSREGHAWGPYLTKRSAMKSAFDCAEVCVVRAVSAKAASDTAAAARAVLAQHDETDCLGPMVAADLRAAVAKAEVWDGGKT